MAELALTILLLAVAGYAVLRWIRTRATAMAALLSHGETVTGTIVMAERVRRSRTHKACRVRYAFTARDGAEYEREIEVLPKEFARYSEGQAVEVVYDLSNPESSMLKSAVQDARDARRNIHAQN